MILYWSNIMDSHDCMECHGRKVVKASIELERLCPRCDGKGHVDWITNIMGKSSVHHAHAEYQDAYNVTMKNIHRLINEIKLQGSKLDIIVNIDVKMQNRHYQSKNGGL